MHRFQKTREPVSNSFRQFPFQSERPGILEWVPHPRCPGCWNRTVLLGHSSTTSTTQAEKSSRCRRKSEHGLWTCSEQVAHGSSAAATDIALCKFPFASCSWQEVLAPSVDFLQQAALQIVVDFAVSSRLRPSITHRPPCSAMPFLQGTAGHGPAALARPRNVPWLKT